MKIMGKVIEGVQVGAKFGVATANLSFEDGPEQLGSCISVKGRPLEPVFQLKFTSSILIRIFMEKCLKLVFPSNYAKQ